MVHFTTNRSKPIYQDAVKIRGLRANPNPDNYYTPFYPTTQCYNKYILLVCVGGLLKEIKKKKKINTLFSKITK